MKEESTQHETLVDVFVHDTAVIDHPVWIGAGSRIWHFSHVMSGAVLGKDTVLGQNVFVAGSVVIGDRVKVQNNVSLYEGLIIEDEVFIGPSAVFTNISTPRAHLSRRDKFQSTRICRGATIGANATIVCGNTIGAYAFIGAGAVVTQSVPAYALSVGNPARCTGWVCRCGVRLKSSTCAECNARYRLEGQQLLPEGES